MSKTTKDLNYGLYVLVGMIGRDAVLELLRNEQADAEQEAKRMADVIAEFSRRSHAASTSIWL